MNKTLEYYMSLPYRVEIVKDLDEGGYAICCPELPGCITCSETVEEGTKLLEDAKQAWFQACLKDGLTIPEPHREVPQ